MRKVEVREDEHGTRVVAVINGDDEELLDTNAVLFFVAQLISTERAARISRGRGHSEHR